MSTPSDDDAQSTGSVIPSWAVYTGVGIASYVAYKTLFKEERFVHDHRHEELKQNDMYTAEYPSDGKYFVTNPWDNVEIRRSKRGPASWKPVRVFEMFEKAVKNAPSSVMWKKEYRSNDADADSYTWRSWTRQSVYDLVQQAARAFIACGLQPWQAVTIIGFNSPEWMLADLGAIYAGGIVAGQYTTNNAGQCKYIAIHSKAAVAVVENRKQLGKFLQIRDELPDLKVIVVWDMDEHDPIIAASNTDKASGARVMHWKEFMQLGSEDSDKKAELDAQKQERMDNIKPGQCCTLIYTSGTTGAPKAVMISHDNVTWQSRAAIEFMKSIKKDGSPHATVSYLPLSHIAAQMLDIFYPLAFAAHYPQCKSWQLYFARPDALKGTLTDTLRTARPTIFFGVPRVWEKMQEGIIKKARENPSSAVRKWLIDYLKGVNVKAYYARQLGGDMTIPFAHSFAQKMLTATVKSVLGLDRLQIAASAAAPISVATLEFWGSLGIDVVEAYGMSECTGVHTACLPYYFKAGTVGVPLSGVTTLLQNDPERDTPGHGEICMRGRHVMMGYMYDEEKTKRTIDEEGYLHTGDVGVIDDAYNVLKITGRIKELIITAGGENIAPTPIEDYLKQECPGISNVMVVGDRKKYLTCLITLKCKQNLDTMEYSNQLDSVALDVDTACTTCEDAKKSDKWTKYIQDAVDRYNKDPDVCVSNAQKVQYFRILSGDFGVGSGELTATMKLKRPIVAKKHHTTIESMYATRVNSK
eukprot:CAMPEP_0202691554 /NCGR_PEP_ID=MMETSP1385-20130828/6235_1 /ASSEMBLY_ACC=CAM_ASM_000861 /TAXON_ID=933848 /ORGANISM="Elphidium margaritaceum" /LENGTH=752 /DNA_ID=CAMNT_0049346981 /DNA_START=44 /DNA_END=2302 /DNA_ORIENTATION=-